MEILLKYMLNQISIPLRLYGFLFGFNCMIMDSKCNKILLYSLYLVFFNTYRFLKRHKTLGSEATIGFFPLSWRKLKTQ